ncbi:MAG: hypothetical protein IJB63_09585 [Alistipes sp.]|nr:hypothetical protein [Alistipes sp.]
MIKKNEKRSFVFYDSFLEAMKHLNDAEFRECVLKIRDYALEGVDEESSSPMVNVIMELAKPNLDSARRRYMASVENGKKGAEYGKLGGAPKGNQNARKKQPLNQPQKQPLDVDANEDVEEDVNEEVNVNGDDDGDTPSGTIGFQSSISNSSIGFQEEEIENDSERLEENNERNLGFDFKGFEFVAASEVEKEPHINSKSESNNTHPVSLCSEEGAGSCAARPRQQKEPGMDMSEYLEQYIYKNAIKLAHIRKNELPNDDKLFWRTVDFCCDLNGDSKDKAAKFVTDLVNEIIRQNVV